MATNKKITDLTDYTSVLPYASEIFGVYQPMIGWKSKRVLERMKKAIDESSIKRFRDILKRYEGIADVKVTDFGGHNELFFQLLDLRIGIHRNDLMLKYQDSGSVLLSELSAQIKTENFHPQSTGEWKEFINEEKLTKLLHEKVYPIYEEAHKVLENPPHQLNVDDKSLTKNIILGLKTESALAKALIDLVENDLPNKLEELFFIRGSAKIPTLQELFQFLKEDNFQDPFATFDPKGNIIEHVCVSPIGIVHLYRQYFFELDTFLGTPVSHVWLSPGSSVELIETSSRKYTEERYQEFSTNTTTKTEISENTKDDISEAVKAEDRSDMKLGFTATVNQSWGSGNFSATGSLNMDKTQTIARDHAHKKTYEQSKKLSKEIRNNYKSTFKTITETIDTSSKRYVLNNSTRELINYELRRKMRQVGVQIQDIGSYLCWQTFVDDPGNDLGLPNLIHIAKATMVDGKPEHPQKPYLPDDVFKDYSIQIPFVGTSPDNDDKGELYINGRESNNDGSLTIETNFPYKFDIDKPNYFLDTTNGISVSTNNSAIIQVKNPDKNGSMVFYLKSVHFEDKPFITVNVRLKWVPDRVAYNQVYVKAMEKYEKDMAEFKVKEMKAEKEDYMNKVKDRVTLASGIKKRKFENLREEERTIVYRRLIKSLMTEKHFSGGNYQTQHILSELINAVFDIDKMLYFVAPEWWRAHNKGKTFFGEPNKINLMEGSNATWGNEQIREDNYYITEKSEPAPLGSSLGWLLQLDGDDLRNAFLNAPWVKAVIPIRPGKEKAAMAWLQNVGVEGSDGLDATYSAPDDELVRINVYLNTGKVPKQFSDEEWAITSEATAPNQVTIKQALDFLCAEVAYKEEYSKDVYEYNKGVKGKKVVGKARDEEINDDNKVLATPIEKVYEHGFYPLKGGFRAVVEDYFETISQWIEVLPTDQIVPVEVKYDPKTGRQV